MIYSDFQKIFSCSLVQSERVSLSDFVIVAGKRSDEDWIARIQDIRQHHGLTLAVIVWMYPARALFQDQPSELFYCCENEVIYSN